MISVLAGLAASKAGRAAGAVLVIGLALGGLYLKGRSDGRANVLGQLAAERVTILKDGKAIDDATDLLDDDGLCAVLGGCGVPDGAAGH